MDPKEIIEALELAERVPQLQEMVEKLTAENRRLTLAYAENERLRAQIDKLAARLLVAQEKVEDLEDTLARLDGLP